MGGKTRKKKTSTPEEFKEKGNTYLQKGLLTEALNCYTKGLQLQSNNKFLLSNRSAVHNLLHMNQEAIEDAQAAISIDPNWDKPYFRLCKAYEASGQLDSAILAIDSALSIKDLEEYRETKLQLQKQLSYLSSIPPEHKSVSEELVQWLVQGGTTIQNVEMTYYPDGERGLSSKFFIPSDTNLIVIPKNFIVSVELAKNSEIGQKIHSSNLNLVSPKHCLLSAFLLEESSKDNTPWTPYLKSLPKDLGNFPVFYTEEEKAWLKGSPTLLDLTHKLEDLVLDYEAICNSVPEFKKFELQEFIKMRTVVGSRVFSMKVQGEALDGMVPLADMLNHKVPRVTKWSFEDSLDSFVVKSQTAIEKGCELCDSYGKKSNSRFLLNYGFVIYENEADEFQFRIELYSQDPLLQQKAEMMGGNQVQIINAKANSQDMSFHKLVTYLRFVELQDPLIMPELFKSVEGKNNKDPILIGPMSIQNETRVLLHIQNLCIAALNKYPTTLSQDLMLFQAKSQLPQNNTNCLAVRIGEKRILQWYLEFAEFCLPLLKLSREEIRKVKSTPYANYVSQVVVPLIKKL